MRGSSVYIDGVLCYTMQVFAELASVLPGY